MKKLPKPARYSRWPIASLHPSQRPCSSTTIGRMTWLKCVHQQLQQFCSAASGGCSWGTSCCWYLDQASRSAYECRGSAEAGSALPLLHSNRSGTGHAQGWPADLLRYTCQEGHKEDDTVSKFHVLAWLLAATLDAEKSVATPVYPVASFQVKS